MTHFLQQHTSFCISLKKEGKTCEEIATRLNEAGVRTKKGKLVGNSQVSQLLINNGYRQHQTKKSLASAASQEKQSTLNMTDAFVEEDLIVEILRMKKIPKNLKMRMINTVMEGI